MNYFYYEQNSEYPVSQIPEVDLIIISTEYEVELIEERLRHIVPYPILTLQDIIG